MSGLSFRLLLAVVLTVSQPLSSCMAGEPPTTAASSASSVDARDAEDQATVDLATQRGVAWLLQQQSSDGSWRSETYGSLENGLGTTALVVSALTELAQPTEETQTAASRGINFLKAHVNSEGLVQGSGGDAEYPVYATALLLSALNRTPESASSEWNQRLSKGLLARQRVAANGWKKTDPDWGGWGPGAELIPGEAFVNPANISVTRHALEALSAAKTFTPEVLENALQFVSRCQLQQADHVLNGGFFFTLPADHPLNKAGWERAGGDGQKIAIPYRSATCDGYLALQICKLPPDEERLVQAQHLLAHFPPINLATEPLDSGQTYSPLQAIWFYHAASWGKVWQRSDPKFRENKKLQQHQQQTLQTLLKAQQQSGAWSNPLPWMLEDDPLLATAQAIQALQRLTTH